MADITVRKMRFSFEEPFNLEVSNEEQSDLLLMLLGLSMTMPFLEPYLIRTMKVAIRQITDSALAEDTKRFCQQEAHHYKNHLALNEQIRSQFDQKTKTALRTIEDELETDYKRFSHTKPLRFNLVYAEGFEAMTCAASLTAAERGLFADSQMPGGELWAWHMAEEIEHRTVAFQAYEHLVGSYPYRILRGFWAQLHYLSYVRRFEVCMANALGRPAVRLSNPTIRATLRRYLRTWSPLYDPAKIELPKDVQTLLDHYTVMGLGT